MTTKTKTDAQLIAAYRRAAAGRRTKSVLNSLPSSVDEAVKNSAGVATVKKAQGSVPVSELGGQRKPSAGPKFRFLNLNDASVESEKYKPRSGYILYRPLPDIYCSKPGWRTVWVSSIN